MKALKRALSLILAAGLAMPVIAQESAVHKLSSRLEKLQKLATSPEGKAAFHAFELALGTGLLTSGIANKSIQDTIGTLMKGSFQEASFLLGAHTACLILIGHGIHGLRETVPAGSLKRIKQAINNLAHTIAEKTKETAA